MEHYFSEKTKTPSDPKRIELHFDNKSYPFITDHGVFSRDRLDFGTGLLLKTSMNSLSGKVLDLGCGYGPVGVLVYLNRGILCDMVDVNERALHLAKENLKLNRAQGEVFYSDGFSATEKAYDTILLNPPIRRGKEIIYGLFEEARHHLAPEGRLIIVIQKKQGMLSAKKKLEELYENVVILDKKGGYYVLEARLAV
ncbi:MAG: class I SAM-dependent methyltransferase [Tissierellia bacterium]|nr:class I SAM-dependent methyltransferase [Tissierellia bacterium]